MNAFILSQFGYFTLVWIFDSRKLNNHINNIHGRVIRIVFQRLPALTFQQLLKQNKFVFIY